MPEKSPQKPAGKKVGKSIKEKRRDKKDKQDVKKGLGIKLRSGASSGTRAQGPHRGAGDWCRRSRLAGKPATGVAIDQIRRTFAACRPFGPWLVSNSTFCPSSRLR